MKTNIWMTNLLNMKSTADFDQLIRNNNKIKVQLIIEVVAFSFRIRLILNWP